MYNIVIHHQAAKYCFEHFSQSLTLTNFECQTKWIAKHFAVLTVLYVLSYYPPRHIVSDALTRTSTSDHPNSSHTCWPISSTQTFVSRSWTCTSWLFAKLLELKSHICSRYIVLVHRDAFWKFVVRFHVDQKQTQKKTLGDFAKHKPDLEVSRELFYDVLCRMRYPKLGRGSWGL